MLKLSAWQPILGIAAAFALFKAANWLWDASKREQYQLVRQIASSHPQCIPEGLRMRTYEEYVSADKALVGRLLDAVAALNAPPILRPCCKSE